MKNAVLISLMCVLLFGFFSCQEEDLSVNSKEELQEKLKAEVMDNNLTSIAYCVVKGDKMLYSDALGFADEDNNRLAKTIRGI